MGIQQDFLARMIEQLADTFGRIFDGSGVEDEDRAIFELESVLAEVFRTRRELLFMRTQDRIESFDPRLAAEVGRLFLKHSELSEAQGHAKDARRSYRLAIQCLRGGLGEDLSHRPDGANGLMRTLLRAQKTTAVLDAAQMADTWRDIFEIEARRQHYPAAEDAIFSAIAMADDPTDHVRRGIRFFESLLRLPDELLDERDLPRSEVDEAIAELKAL